MLKPSKLSKPSDLVFWHGNLDECWQAASLEERETFKQLHEQALKLERWRIRAIPASQCQELWAFKWIVQPTIYLFPSHQWEMIFGDMYEITAAFLNQGKAPVWINIQLTGKMAVLVLGAIQIQFQNLVVSIWKKQ